MNSQTATATGFAALRVRANGVPGAPLYGSGSRVAVLLLAKIVAMRFPGGQVACCGPLEDCGCLVSLDGGEPRRMAAELYRLARECDLLGVSQIHWFDGAELIWRCAYPDTRLRFTAEKLQKKALEEAARFEVELARPVFPRPFLRQLLYEVSHLPLWMFRQVKARIVNRKS